ncbi:MAG: arginine--tRNA ligase, partial [Bacteroidota bacterium]
MSRAIQNLKQLLSSALSTVYDIAVEPNELNLTVTKKEFDGEFTLVVFPYTRQAKKKPEDIAHELGTWLMTQDHTYLSGYNVVKGFLNLELTSTFWIESLYDLRAEDNFGIQTESTSKMMVEFCSPNTNKPLHLGHIRNILLGWSTSMIHEAVGYPVVKTQIINDRGIAICKSMLAWQLEGKRVTPDSAQKKGDHLVGDYYILFDQMFQEEYNTWKKSEEGISTYNRLKKPDEEQNQFWSRYKNQYFNEYSALGKQSRDMLQQWEAENPEVRALWKQMNGWVYEGFEETYQALGVHFDKLYYESDTYLLGKDIINQGLQQGHFYKENDGSIWVDLEDVGLDKKILLRSDGTSVYMTQDLGTAQMRYHDLGTEKMIYVVGDEQDYHFQALFEILKKMGEPYADHLYHLSYGMVDLPTGKMKSRDGNVVDADDLVAEVIAEVKASAEERGELDDVSASEREDIYRKIALAAIKFFILKVNPKKRMLFNPQDSVDMQGQTGPYIQNAFV